nr:MAG TPA: hypothetical protein [Caudoviricetes sp.]
MTAKNSHTVHILFIIIVYCNTRQQKTTPLPRASELLSQY